MPRILSALVVVAACLFFVAGPAGADPAKPTNYRSTVASIAPASPYVRMKVVGGDGFLDLDVVRGHEVVVEGYLGEPYLRVLKDGTVQQNSSSPATYLNRSRFAKVTLPAALQRSPLPAPQWRTIGSGGHSVWHDHRIHFMGHNPHLIAGLAEGRPVRWTVAFSVDGVKTVASGSYRMLGAPSPLPYVGGALVLVAAVVLLGRRNEILVAAICVVVAGIVGFLVGWEQNAAIPAGAGATPITVALPALGAALGLVGLAKRKVPAGVITTLAGVACAGGWVLTRATVLWKAVLPTVMAPGLDRAGTALVAGLAIGAAVIAVRSGALAAAPAPAQADGPPGTAPA